MVEQPFRLIGVGGEEISADSIRAHLSADHQKAIDDKLAEWFGREADTRDAEGLRNLGRQKLEPSQ